MTRCWSQSSGLALDRAAGGGPLQIPASVHTEGLTPLPTPSRPAPLGLTGTPCFTGLSKAQLWPQGQQRDRPWRCLRSTLLAWAACWHHGRAAGQEGGGAGDLRPLESYRTEETSSAPNRAHAHTATCPQAFSSKQKNIRVSQGEELRTKLSGDLPPGYRTALHLTQFSVSGIARPGLRHSSESFLDVKQRFCCPAECSQAGISQTGSSEPHPAGLSKGKASMHRKCGNLQTLQASWRPLQPISTLKPLRRDLDAWFNPAFPQHIDPELFCKAQ